jgi:hypothetical protein
MNKLSPEQRRFHTERLMLCLAKKWLITPRHGSCNGRVSEESVKLVNYGPKGKQRVLPVGRCGSCDQDFVSLSDPDLWQPARLVFRKRD